MNISMLISFVIYFFVVACISFIGYKVSMSSVKLDKDKASDFMLGHRSLNYWLTALSAHASDMSSWLFMAFPGLIISSGFSACWVAIGLFIFMYMNWTFIAPKLRVQTEKYNSSTLSSFFEKRFKDKSGMIRIISGVMCIVFFTIYIASGLKAIGLLFETSFGVPYYWGVLLGIFIVFLYTFIGGYLAVAWTDLFQALFLLFMIILVPLYATGKLGGWSVVHSSVIKSGISLSLLPNFKLATILKYVFIALGWGLGYFGMPHILTKFMGIKKVSEMKKSKYVGMTWQFLTLTAAIFVGLVGIAFFKSGLADPELVFIELVTKLFSPFFAGFILCAILAAIISTIDSQILVLASVITDDFYKEFFHKNASGQVLLWIYRIGICVVCAVSCIVAFFSPSETIMDLVFYSWAGLGCSFGPLVILSLYCKKINRYGAVSGILVGGISSALWKLYMHPLVESFLTKEFAMVFGFVLSFITIYLVSIATNKKLSSENLYVD